MKRDGVLLIGGDVASRAQIVLALEEAGFRVTDVPDAGQGLRSIYESRPDLVIMAQDLTVANAEDVCSRLRQVSHLPIIVLGREQENMQVKMLEAGADAYMYKPPDPRELVARVRVLLRRRKGPGPGCAEGGPACELRGRTARRGNGLGDLTRTEFRLLSCLMLNEGRLVSHPQLVSEVWGGKKVSKDCLRSHLHRLRRKLSRALASPGDIVNCWGIGYRFCRSI